MPDSSPINDAAARGFQRGAEDYRRDRPDYPVEVFTLLAEELPVTSGTRVCDLAAGTGKFSVGLLGLGASVVAIEPVEAMRRLLRTDYPDAEALDGTAEAIPLEASSVDAVTVAQAFHWFNAVPALDEIQRVLRPRGAFALVWNIRDESVSWVHEFTELITTRAGGRPYTPYYYGAEAGWSDERLAVVTEHGGFTPLAHRLFDNPQMVTPGRVVGRAASTSFVSALPDDRREGLLAEVRDLVANHPQTRGLDRFVFPHHTVVIWCHRTS